jgi:hypothetical protein
VGVPDKGTTWKKGKRVEVRGAAATYYLGMLDAH